MDGHAPGQQAHSWAATENGGGAGAGMAQTSTGIRNYVRRLGSFAVSALEANQHDLPLPYRLFLYVTDACNCRCNMCSIWQKPTDNELTTDELLQVLADARQHVKWMDVTGGEIF